MFEWLRQKDPTESNAEHVHNFGKWEIARRVRLFDSDKATHPYALKTVQERSCKVCGFTEFSESQI